MNINYAEIFQRQLDELITQMQRPGIDLELHAVWMDECGGMQSIVFGSTDRLVIRPKGKRDE